MICVWSLQLSGTNFAPTKILCTNFKIYSNLFLSHAERPDSPRVVTIMSWTARSVYLEWEPSFDGNLDILGYNIYQNDLDRNLMNQPVANATHPEYTTDQQEFNVTDGIIPYTKYVFTIEACNLLGCGARNQSEPRRTNTDGNTVTIAPNHCSYFCIVQLLTHHRGTAR